MGQVRVWRVDEDTVFGKQDGKEIKDRDLVIEGEYRRVGDEALKNNIRIRRVIMGERVREIGVRSFSGCTNLQMMEMKKVDKIRKEAFAGCVKLKTVVFPSELQILGKSAFSNCKRLAKAEVFFNNRCKMLEEDVFAECEAMQQCILGDHIQHIQARAFYKCVSLEEFVFPAELHSIGKEAFYQTALKELHLPESLEIIGDSAFLKCNQLEYVRIPASVKKIEKWAFHGCNRLKVLEIPYDLEEIGDWIINRSAKIRCYPGSKVDEYCKAAGLETEYM